jgi:hypothetical protein
VTNLTDIAERILRLEEQRQNTEYVLTHIELMDQDRRETERRLASIEEELQHILDELPKIMIFCRER